MKMIVAWVAWVEGGWGCWCASVGGVSGILKSEIKYLEQNKKVK